MLAWLLFHTKFVFKFGLHYQCNGNQIWYASLISDRYFCGYQSSVVLLGEHATALGESVLQSAEKGLIVAVFVGTLVKLFEGCRGLSCSAPCHRYFNEDLPEINKLLTRLHNKVPVVQSIPLLRKSAAEKTKFFYTVVITKLSPGQRYWFSSCTTCHKSAVPDDTEYRMGKEIVGRPLTRILRSGLFDPQHTPGTGYRVCSRRLFYPKGILLLLCRTSIILSCP